MTKKAMSITLLVLLVLSAVPLSPFESETVGLLEDRNEAMFKGFMVGEESHPWNSTSAWGEAKPEGFAYLDAIEYTDVGVVINNASEESRTIGWAFVAARNIPIERVFVFNASGTPDSETINRNQFDTYFATPFLEMLQNRSSSNSINFLVTTKGVPLRISGGNDKASFDQELSLLGGSYNSSIGNDYWFDHAYGPLAGKAMEPFTRSKYGFFLVTRLTGYTVETALELIERANQSLGQRGDFVLDVATNRNSSGYKFWNDALYDANTTLNGSMNLPVMLDEETVFLTGLDNLMGYASWGSNDGNWNINLLPNAGFDTADTAWSSGARYWNSTMPTVSGGDTIAWAHQSATKRNGNHAMELALSTACDQEGGRTMNGVYAEYFDNDGVSFNSGSMPTLIDRTPDHVRVESQLDHSVSNNAYPGLDDRFKQHWGARFSGFVDVPHDGNWTFYINSDDGSELWINGESVVQNYGMHGMREGSGWVNLTAGLHDFRVEFFQGGGPHGLIFSWEGPNTSKAVVPTSAFFVSGGPTPRAADLVHEWMFEDGSGTSAEDSAGNADFDGVGNGSWVSCVDGGCLQFDGIDDVVSVDVDDWTGSFSVSQWVLANVSNMSNYASTFAVDNAAGSSGSFQHMVSNQQWRFHTNQSHVFGDVEPQRWSHLVSTFNNGTVKQYMDGVLVNTLNLSSNQTLTIDRLKLGVNRAGNAYFHGKIDNLRVWDAALDDHAITTLRREIIDNCTAFSGHGNDVATVTTVYDFSGASQNYTEHAWLLSAYGQRSGDVFGSFSVEVEALDSQGQIVSVNSTTERSFGPSWSTEVLRFRPDVRATAFRITASLDIVPTSTGGSLFLDTMSLRPIRPHMSWVNGSIGETAVSTGGRSFNWGTTYGQSLIADLLEDGISGVKGYVYEPYLTAVGRPDVLLPTYASGYNLAESHAAANLQSGWMGVVVGDPKMSPYADIYHDVRLIDVHVQQPVHRGEDAVVQVLLENRGMSSSNGTLRLETLVGSELLNSTSLTLPAGDEWGSRTVINLTMVAPSSGLLDLRLRYTNSTPERLFHNNLLSFQTQVNDPPSISSTSCRASSVTRGTYTICSATASDDGNVTSVLLEWRIADENNASNNSHWNALPLGQINPDTWESALVIPVDAPLGTLVIRATATDNLGFNVTSQAINASLVVDSPARWYGPHVSDVDDPAWTGESMLNPQPSIPMPRHLNQTLRACVADEDRRPTEPAPVFLTERGQATPTVTVSEERPGLFCFESTIVLGAGSSLEPLDIEVRTVEGSLLLQRQFRMLDVAPTLTVSAENGEGETLDRLVGNGMEYIVTSVTDVDDPNPAFVGDAYVQWPGGAPSQTPIDIPASNASHRLLLSQVATGLEAGDVVVEVVGNGPNGVEANAEVRLPFLLTPPEIVASTPCNDLSRLESMTFGEIGTLLVGVSSERPVERITAQLVQEGWAVTAPITDDPVWGDDAPEPCATPNRLNGSTVEWTTFRLRLDPSFVDGSGQVLVNVRDVDGLSSTSSITLQFQHAPTVLGPLVVNGTIPTTDLNMDLNVSDRDGLNNVVCSLAIRTQSGESAMQSSKTAGTATTFNTTMNWMYPLPRSVANETLTLNVTCLDERSNTFNLQRTVAIGPAPTCTDCDNNPDVPALPGEAASTFGSKGILGAGIIALFVALLVAGTVLLRRRGSSNLEEVNWMSTDPGMDAFFDAPDDPEKEAVNSQGDGLVTEDEESEEQPLENDASPLSIPEGWTAEQYLRWLDGPLPDGWTEDQWVMYIQEHRQSVMERINRTEP